ALSVSGHMRGALVLGADQILVCDGRMFNKALTGNDARDALMALSGREHELISAAVVAREGVPVWRRTEIARLRMRELSQPFLDEYLAAEIVEILGAVVSYRIEGRGAGLFAEISLDHICISGLHVDHLLAIFRF